MPRNYRPIGRKRLKKHDPEIIKRAIRDIASGMKYRAAELKYGVPRTVLHRHKTGGGNVKKQGGQTVLHEKEESLLITNINSLADWGYPIDTYDLRLLVKNYLDKLGKNIPRFKNNLPGTEFVYSFLTRNKDRVSKRMCENIKRARAAVSREVIEEYFENLSRVLENVPAANIVNYDETNLSDDIGRKKVITRKGCKHPERIINTTKSATSIMFAVTGKGELLPPYVVYKAQNLYSAWTEGGPRNTRYNRTPSGWFDMDSFEDWVNSIAVPYFKKLEGRKILLGDNLASHISVDVVKELKKHEIDMVFLPPNSTHLTQPLDVAFFRPLKGAWRRILETWKKGEGHSEASVPKSIFPRLLKKLIDAVKENSQKNILSGFRKTGIIPLNKEEVLRLLPKEQLDDTEAGAINSSVIDLLKEMRYVKKTRRQTKNKKLVVQPGKSVQYDSESSSSTLDDNIEQDDFERDLEIESDLDSDDLPLINFSPNKKTEKTVLDFDSPGPSHILNTNGTQEQWDIANNNFETDVDTHITKICDSDVTHCDFNIGDWVLVKFPVERKTATIKNRVYIGKIISISENNFVGSFLRKKGSDKGKIGPAYYYPTTEDVAEFQKTQIIEKISSFKERRGIYTFQSIDTKDYESVD